MEISKLVLSDAVIDAIDNGAWVDEIPSFDGIKLKVRGMNSEPVRKAMEAKQAEQRKKNKGEPLTPEQHKKITQEVLGEVVIQDWAGFTESEVPIAFDKKLAAKWISSRNGEKLASIVLWAAAQVDENAEKFVEKASKN